MSEYEIFHQSVFKAWPIEDKSIQAIITSPPYYGLRKYDIPDVLIGGNKDCQHEFIKLSKDKLLNLQSGNEEFKRHWREDATQTINNGTICIHCKAWKGQYGLEPSYGGKIEYETDEIELRQDLSNEDRKYVLSELLRRGLLA